MFALWFYPCCLLCLKRCLLLYFSNGRLESCSLVQPLPRCSVNKGYSVMAFSEVSAERSLKLICKCLVEKTCIPFLLLSFLATFRGFLLNALLQPAYIPFLWSNWDFFIRGQYRFHGSLDISLCKRNNLLAESCPVCLSDPWLLVVGFSLSQPCYPHPGPSNLRWTSLDYCNSVFFKHTKVALEWTGGALEIVFWNVIAIGQIRVLECMNAWSCLILGPSNAKQLSGVSKTFHSPAAAHVNFMHGEFASGGMQFLNNSGLRTGVLWNHTCSGSSAGAIMFEMRAAKKQVPSSLSIHVCISGGSDLFLPPFLPCFEADNLKLLLLSSICRSIKILA